MNKYHALTPEEQAAQYKAEWSRDAVKVAEVLVAFEENGDSLAADIAAVLTCHPDDLTVSALRFVEAMRGKVNARLGELATEQVDSDELDAYDRGVDA